MGQPEGFLSPRPHWERWEMVIILGYSFSKHHLFHLVSQLSRPPLLGPEDKECYVSHFGGGMGIDCKKI